MANLYALRECNSALPTIYTNTLLTPGISAYLDQVIQIAGYPDNCWIVVQQNIVDDVPVAVTILASYINCPTCQAAGPPIPTIYRLSDCNKILPQLYTNDLLMPGVATYLGGVVYILEYPETCWSVQAWPTGSPVAYTLINGYEKCSICLAAIPEPPITVFRLINCVDKLQIIYSFTSSLVNVIDKVVNLEGYPNICWSVSTVVYDDQTTEDVTILVNDNGVEQIFDDCECCLPLPEPTPVKYTRVIPKPDRKFYQITQSQCDIQANLRFADNYYRLFKKLKYGMNSMCDNVELDKIWVKKMLSNLAMINDPTACTITPAPEPIICPDPS